MESRIRSLLLRWFAVCLLLASAAVDAADADADPELRPVIEPEVERTRFDESKIETADFEVIGNIGVIAVEDFGSNAALVLKLNYHISEDFFVGAEWVSTKGKQTSFEILSGGAPVLTEDERNMDIYLLTAGYNLLPGEAFVTDNLTYNTSFYVIGGLGKTRFAGDEPFTVSIGAGYRVLIGDFVSLYTDFRDHIYNTDIFGKNKIVNHLQFTLGVGFYF